MSGKQRDYSTDWSEWIWSEEHGCKYATRLNSNGVVEYDYLRPEEIIDTPRDEGHWGSGNATHHGINTSSNTYIPPTGEDEYGYVRSDEDLRHDNGWNIERTPEYERNSSQSTYITSNSPPGVKVAQYKASAGLSQASGPSNSNRALDNVTSQFRTTTLQSLPGLGTITFENPVGERRQATTIKSGVNTEILDDRYVEIDESKQKNKKFWNEGRVFMMLWTEPARAPPGSRGGNNATAGSQYNTVWLGTQVFSEIRRFVVVGKGYGNVICSPIHTYQGQATLKPNLPDPQQHAIIHTSSSPPSELCVLDQEGNVVMRENLIKDPIRVISELDGPEGDLGRLSRINYAKLYTVEKYVRILNIGKVHENSMESLKADCFFARPDQPQPPRKQKPSSSKTSKPGKKEDHNDGRGHSSKSHRPRH